jgi:hypothetical protein
MARGNSISTVGIILLAAGFSMLIIVGSQLFFQIQQNGILLNNVSLEPGQSISAGIGKAGLRANQLSTLIIMSQPSGVPLMAETKNPKGEIISQFEVDKNPFVTTVSAGLERGNTLVITNTGDRDVSIRAAIVNIPPGSAANVPSEPNSIIRTLDLILQPNLLVLAIVGGLGFLLSIAGIIIVIIGVIKTSKGGSAKMSEIEDPSRYPYRKKP